MRKAMLPAFVIAVNPTKVLKSSFERFARSCPAGIALYGDRGTPQRLMARSACRPAQSESWR